MNRKLVFQLATGRFIEQREDGLFLCPPGTGKSHLALAIGLACVHQGHRVLYQKTHILLEELAEAQFLAERKEYIATIATVPLLILDNLGMLKLPPTAAEDLLEISIRRYEHALKLIRLAGQVTA